VGATDQPTPSPTQGQTVQATGEESGIMAQTAGNSAGSANSAGGNGYFLQRSSRNSFNAGVVILFIFGLLAIGAAVVIYYRRKKPGLK
jgi:LPXTG-motif cell wall-anchored protein